MAKLTPVILNEDPNSEGMWNVKIRIGHKSKTAYLATSEFVSKKQIVKGQELKTSYIIDKMSGILKGYNNMLKSNTELISKMSHLEVKEFLEKPDKKVDSGEVVWFIQFAKEYEDSIRPDNESESASSANIIKTIRYSLMDFLGNDDIPATGISSVFLREYELYLRSGRVLKRLNNGVIRESKRKPLKNSSINVIMNGIKKLHRLAKLKYNDEESGIVLIPNSPFDRFKIVGKDRSRNRDFNSSQVAQIRDCKLRPNSRAELTRDIWMLSFYLCGMNSADIYRNKGGESGRIVYNRQKTELKRDDNALTSIKLIDEVKRLYDKYMGKMQIHYKSLAVFNMTLHSGIRDVRKVLGPGFECLDPYSARHSVASIAGNECGYSDEQIGKLLNHEDANTRVTRIYIRKSWSIVDEMQAAVVALLPPKPEE